MTRRNLRSFDHSTHSLSRRAKWELVLGLSGLIYVVLTLSLTLDSPLLSILFIALVGYDLVSGRAQS
jgi:hypothetical protein